MSGEPIEVEHIYGFSSMFTREALNRVGVYDRTLLSQPYSSGDRTEALREEARIKALDRAGKLALLASYET